MNMIRTNRVAAQVSYAEHRVSLAIKLNLVALHDLLDGLTNIAQSDINSCCLYACICGFLDCLQERLVPRIECNCEGTVDQMSIYMSAEVQLADVVVRW